MATPRWVVRLVLWIAVPCWVFGTFTPFLSAFRSFGHFPTFFDVLTDEMTWQKNAHGCVGLDYTADMNPMFGGGDRPRGPGGDPIAWPDRRFQKGAEAGNLIRPLLKAPVGTGPSDSPIPQMGCSHTGADCDNRPGAPPATTGPSADDTWHSASGHSGRYVDTGADCNNRGVSTEIVQARYFVNLVFGTFPLFPSAVLSL